ncbi:MAG: OmpH family outer membrane protein [Proteobacteria bacterium]|nr:OmpH family outer membrane protein [Pseudomonadota bacterium]
MRLTKLVLATAVSAVALASAPGAFAQRNNAASVVVVNYQRLLAESALGRDMSTKLQGVSAQIQQQAQAMQSEGQAIETEDQRLQTATRGMTAAQVQANSALSSQIQALQARVQQFQARRQSLQGDMQCSQIFALRDFTNRANPVVRTVMQSRGAGVVVDAASSQVFDPAMDITNTVMQQLDAAQRTATVARHSVSECQQSASAAPAVAPH